MGYDDGNKGKLEDITHSTLGTTTFEYNADDTLLRYRYNTYIGGTDYVYDAFGRLQALESFRWNGAAGESVGLRGWAYDDLGRKENISIEYAGAIYGSILLDYDDASRLEHEEFVAPETGDWAVDYEYDEAGNGLTWSEPATVNSTGRFLGGDDNVVRIETDGAGLWGLVWASTENLYGALGDDFEILKSFSDSVPAVP